MTTRKNFRRRRETRQAEAKARQERYDALTQTQKEARLIPGGSTRQRERGVL